MCSAPSTLVTSVWPLHDSVTRLLTLMIDEKGHAESEEMIARAPLMMNVTESDINRGCDEIRRIISSRRVV